MAQGGSSTCVIEAETVKLQSMTVEEPGNNQALRITRQLSRREIQLGNQDNGPEGTLPSPTTASEQLERWNHPRVNIYRTIATFVGFVIMYVKSWYRTQSARLRLSFHI
jgi:hypothetical protein